ncbi:MAG TPA: glycosyltransferase family 4 protein [Crocinitomicaceae bacterium]|nr:glycosyltransferase family 4 protein [Crocinitomicaceae bacterium]
MKIAFIITSTGWGGLEMNTLKLAKLLAQQHFDISLVTQENSTIYSKGKELFTSVKLLKKKRKFLDLKNAKELSTFLKTEKITSLMVFDNKDLDLVSWTKRCFYSKLVVFYQQHMQIGINKKDFIHTFRFQAIDHWISPLNYLKDEVTQRTKFDRNKVHVIPIGLDIQKFVPKKHSKEQACQQLGFTPKTPLLGIIGRISEKKGQLFVLEAFLKLRSQGVMLELLIFGSPTVNDPECVNYYQQIVETIKQNKAEDVVHLVEHQEDVSPFYGAVDIFALASHSETYGMVTIEAMLSKITIIATQSGGTSELLAFGKLGALYAYNNQTAFCEQVLWTLTNQEEVQNRAEVAQKIACEQYSQENEVQQIKTLLLNNTVHAVN